MLTQASFVIAQPHPDTQEQSDTGEDAQLVTQTIAVPSSSLQINLDYQSYLLAEVFYQDEDEEKAPQVTLSLSSVQKVLKILFRRIISPNAP